MHPIKRSDLGLTKICKDITLTAIAAKVYNGMPLYHIRPEFGKIIRKNQNSFWRNSSTTSQVLTIHRNIEGVWAKNPWRTFLFVDFSAFDSIHWGKMEQGLWLAYYLPKETVTTIMILYKNIKAIIRSPDGDTGFIEINGGNLQEDTLAAYLFINCLDYALWSSVDLLKKRRRYPTETMTDAEYADQLVLLSNASVLAEPLQRCLWKVVGGITLHINAYKTIHEY